MIKNSADWIAMNGWLIAVIAYAAGWVATFILMLWSMRHEEESYNNEPGEDGAAMLILLFVWPITWCFFINEMRQKRREKRAARAQ